MKVRLAAAHLECDFDERVEPTDSLRTKIPGGVKGKAIETLGEGSVLGEELEAAAVGVGLGGGKLAPRATWFANVETQKNCGRGFATRSVENVGGDTVHAVSHFLRRSLVMCRCCSAASRNSVSPSLCILRRRMA